MPRLKKATPSVNPEGANLEESTGTTSEPAPQPKINGFAGMGENSQDTSASSDSSASVTMKLRDGRIDVDSMRESTKKKVLEALANTPGFFAVPESAKPIPIPDWFFQVAYNLLGALEAFAAQRAGFDQDICRMVFMYTPDEIKVLREPTEAVLKKYKVDSMKYKEEIALVMALAHVHMMKIAALNQLQEKRRSNVMEASTNAGQTM